MSSGKRRMSLAVIVVSLLAAGGLLFWAVDDLVAELGHGAGTAGSAMLHDIAATGNTGELQRLIGAGADVNAVLTSEDSWRNGMTPLMFAAVEGKLEAVRVLLDAGAAVDARTGGGRTALILAAGWGDGQVVQALIDRGARVDARTEDGWTALMMAAGRGDSASVNALLQAGANVDSKNKWGQTALMAAARSGDVEKVRTLLTARADVNARDTDGATALMVATESLAGTEMLGVLLEAGADVNAQDESGVSVLMRAADRGDLEKITALLAAKANPALKDANGRTAGDWARGRDDELGQKAAELLGTK